MLDFIIKGYRTKRYINKYQSLSYQLMIILMEEHRAARLGKEIIGEYSGGNSLYFDEKTWTRLKIKASKIVSRQYEEKIKNLENDELLSLMPPEDELFALEVLPNLDGGGEVITFGVRGKGYSYQYNGYKRSQEKLQRTANRILIATLIYYIVTIFFDFDKISLKTINMYIPKIFLTIPDKIFSQKIYWEFFPTIVIFCIIVKAFIAVYNFRFR